MTQEVAELLKKALALTESERADLACTLIESLDPSVDENVEAAWQDEIRRRVEELRSGKVKTIPWEEVRAQARAILDDQTTR
jgi:putative addiction module component (TIGR02574 family)